MTGYEAAGLWIGLNVLLMALIKGAVGRTRGQTKIDYGAGDNDKMQRMMRVQGNAVEDVPIALIGLGALAFMAAPIMLLHGLGGTLFLSRLLHAFGLGGSGGISFGRVAGTIGSVLVLLITSVACIWLAVT
jgi:uncharacterized membrane protein YecN with MAPEG domain